MIIKKEYSRSIIQLGELKYKKMLLIIIMLFIFLTFLSANTDYSSNEFASKEKLTNIINDCHGNIYSSLQEVLKHNISEENKAKLADILKKHKKFIIIDIFGDNNNMLKIDELEKHLENLANVVGQIRNETDNTPEFEDAQFGLSQASEIVGHEFDAIREYTHRPTQGL